MALEQSKKVPLNHVFVNLIFLLVFVFMCSYMCGLMSSLFAQLLCLSLSLTPSLPCFSLQTTTYLSEVQFAVEPPETLDPLYKFHETIAKVRVLMDHSHQHATTTLHRQTDAGLHAPLTRLKDGPFFTRYIFADLSLTNRLNHQSLQYYF